MADETKTQPKHNRKVFTLSTEEREDARGIGKRHATAIAKQDKQTNPEPKLASPSKAK